MNKKVLLQDLSDRVSQRRNISKKDADLFVRSVFEVIGEYLQADKIVKVKGLGTFKLVTVESRASVDVNTGERIVIKGYTKVSFTPDAVLRDEINKPFAQFETVILNEDTDVEEMERMDSADPLELPVSECISDDTVLLPEPDVVPEVTTPDVEPESEIDPVAEQAVVVETAAIEDDVIEEPEIREADTESSVVSGDSDTQPEPCEQQPVHETSKEPCRNIEEHVAHQQVEFQKVEHQTVENQHIVQVASDHTECKCTMSLWTWIFMVIAVLLLMAGSYYAGHKHLLCSEDCVMQVSAPVAGQAEKASSGQPDASVRKEVSGQPEKSKNETPQEQVKPEREEPQKNMYPQVDGGEYEIVGTKEVHKLASGETLRGLSLKYYGSKDYVSYIIVYNEIKNPDLVPVNMELKMPELKLKPR